MAIANILAALLVQGAVTSGERIEMEQRGKVLVDRWFRGQIPRGGGRRPAPRHGVFKRSTTRFGDITRDEADSIAKDFWRR